ncbi:hypothetical protein VTN77DRAFT_7119 [Rasamsonia byssochlamydoides]|uniref:uncharacterized protein n=1 Tax=Rasamsonia byssochlamydoides TaxID=89139 RepID=UPI0037423F0F
MSFGWSASDIYTLVLVCYNVVENCKDGLTSASTEVKSLQEEVQEFSFTLTQLQQRLSETGDAFLDLSEVKKSLEACNSSLSRPKELFDKSKDVGMKYGEAIKYSTWGGDQELRVLQTKLSRHRQSLLLYMQILDRKKRTEENTRLDKQLQKVEAMVRDLHARTRRYSSSTSLETNPDAESPYQSILRAVSQQKALAILGSQQAENDEQLQEWNDICSQLEFIHRRVLNTIERTVNYTAQRREGPQTSQISLNRVLASRSTVDTPPSFRPPHRVETDDGGFCESLPPLREEKKVAVEKASGTHSADPIAANATPLTPSSILFKRTSAQVNDHRGWSPRSSVDSVSYFPQPDSPQRLRTSSITSSEISLAVFHSHWQAVEFGGWVKISCADQKTPVPCSLHAGYDTDGRVYVLKAVDIKTDNQILILKLSTTAKRPIPHAEPPGGRDNPMEGIRAYFIDPPSTEPPTRNIRFFFQNQNDHWRFQSLVYGQKLILSMLVEKISSSNDRLADRQYIRIWKPVHADSSKVLLFYASMKSKPGYITLSSEDVAPNTKIPKRGCVLDLSLANNKHSKSLSNNLKLTFSCRNGEKALFPSFG